MSYLVTYFTKQEGWKESLGTSQVIQWQRLHTPNAGGGGVQVRFPVRELDAHATNATKILYVATKTQGSQISTY